MSGQGGEWKFAADTARQSREGWPLREQLLWRVEQLTRGQSIDLAEHVDHFPEVISGFGTTAIEPVLVARDDEGKLMSKASLEDGGSLVVTGFLRAMAGEFVGSFKRRLQLEPGWAVHEQLVIVPEHRGKGIAPEFLLSSFDLYDRLGLEEVHVLAGLETGRWYWAHMGFDFMKAGERTMVLAWANEVVAALGLEGLEIGEHSSAGQIARLDCDEEISLEALAQAMPNQRERLEEKVALTNGMEMTRPITLGRAIMLSGPEWRGFLQLQGPHRLAFNEAAAERQMRAGLPAAAEGYGTPGAGDLKREE
ncbi:MAG TPA: hypothetical protein VFT19_04760 [Solirubrobacterales bacterium]|nr:hypothetical protein [Solirubrobacterales bacterium]